VTAEPDLLAFAEDPQVFVAIGPDQERIMTDRFVLTFSPGEHFWSTGVSRVRFDVGDVRGGVREVRELVRRRGRRAAAWTIGPSATPRDVVPRLLEIGLEPESDEGSVMLVMTEAPKARSTTFEARRVSTLQEHLSAIDVANEGFAFPEEDAADERRRAPDTFEAERAGGHTIRLLVLDGDRPVATGQGWLSPSGIYLGGGATIPSHRRRGGLSDLVAAAWTEAVRRGTPALVTFGGAMSRSPLERLGFRSVGRVHHLIDRLH
jgi:hypothetical protein